MVSSYGHVWFCTPQKVPIYWTCQNVRFTGRRGRTDNKKISPNLPVGMYFSDDYLLREDVIDTKASLSADEEFLMMLKEKCSMTDSEWEKRSKTRALEMEACSKALAFLTSDNAQGIRCWASKEIKMAAVSH